VSTRTLDTRIRRMTPHLHRRQPSTRCSPDVGIRAHRTGQRELPAWAAAPPSAPGTSVKSPGSYGPTK
jgi:hypothetical protein